PGLGALVLVETLEREAPVAPRRPGRHRHGDEDHLPDLLVAGSRLRGPLGVRVDAPCALRDVGDTERDQLLRLERQRAVGERLVIEVEPGPIGVGRQFTHASELSLHVHTVKHHDRHLLRIASLYTTMLSVAAPRRRLLYKLRRCPRSWCTAAPERSTPVSA